MYTRFLTYDLNYATSDEYQDLYDLIEEYDYKKITESTYEISTNEDWKTFKNKFFKATHAGDNVKAIVKSEGEMKVWIIR
mgnify:FL=1